MSAPQGNKFWEARTTHGRGKIFETPEILWAACVEYFEWTEANPLIEEKVFCAQGQVTRANIAKMRAMTIFGLCRFLGIARTTWEEYSGREDFKYICSEAENVIRDQKFTGAAADMLNANIIARDLGLRDKQDHEHTGGVTVEIVRFAENKDPP